MSLIESMIAQGRRDTESWGWTFVLWGVAYGVALTWSASGHRAVWAWPVTMLIAIIVTAGVASRKAGHHPKTTLGRAIGSIWIALAISMFLLFVPLGVAGRLTDQHVFAAVVSAILGMANGASGLILRWKVQLACAVVWWVAAVASCFGTDTESTIVFVAAIFLGLIVFGICGMITDALRRRQGDRVHA